MSKVRKEYWEDRDTMDWIRKKAHKATITTGEKVYESQVIRQATKLLKEIETEQSVSNR